MLHAFAGEPIRTLTVSVSSVVVGLVISFVYMWYVYDRVLYILRPLASHEPMFQAICIAYIWNSSLPGESFLTSHYHLSLFVLIELTRHISLSGVRS